MLLEDTDSDQVKPEAGKRLSQTATAKALPSIPGHGQANSKTLPQLPSFLFNGDDAWAMRAAPVVTAAGMSNQIDFSADTTGSQDFPTESSDHLRKASTPSIPRKSSKRRSVRPMIAVSQPRVAGLQNNMTITSSTSSKKLQISAPELISAPQQKRLEAVDITGKITGMLAANQALKGDGDGTLLQGPLVPEKKKRRLMDNPVLTKVKTALNGLQGFATKKRDHEKEEKLLHSLATQVQDHTEVRSATPSPSPTTLSNSEIRLNEEGQDPSKTRLCQLS